HRGCVCQRPRRLHSFFARASSRHANPRCARGVGFADMDLIEAKQALRAQARDRRKAAHAERGAAAAIALADAFDRLITVPPAAVISGYWPAGSALDIRPLLERLHRGGHRLVLPVVVERDAPLAFRVWRPGDAVVKGNGAWVPEDGKPTLAPDLLLIPLV